MVFVDDANAWALQRTLLLLVRWAIRRALALLLVRRALHRLTQRLVRWVRRALRQIRQVRWFLRAVVAGPSFGDGSNLDTSG